MLSRAQYDFLLRDLPSGRVSGREVQGRKLSYVEAWDIRRTLIRVFGFGGFSTEVVDVALAFEQEVTIGKGDKQKPGWNVGYRVVLRLTVPTLGQDGVTYQEAAVGFASLPDRGEAHDMAVKTAESDALKRCAANLGTQFGLSLYNGGSQADVVIRTLVVPEGDPAEAHAMPENDVVVPEQPLVDEETGEVLSGLTPEQEDILGALRSLATEPDSTSRIQQVAAIKAAHHDDGVLQVVVEVGGKPLTLAALADNVAAGMYLPKQPQGGTKPSEEAQS